MRFLLIVLGCLAVFVLYLKLNEKRMIYFPTRTLDWTPATAGLKFEELTLRCADGATTHGWFIPASSNETATVLFLHGNAGNISHRSEKILILHQLGLNVCIVDYHGYGQSEGEPGEKETYLDADAAYEWLTKQRQVSPKQILVWGESLGGGIASYVAAKHAVGGLVLESTYTTLPAVGKRSFPFLPTKLLMATQYDSLSRMKQIHVPVLSLHSPQDEVIPYDLGKRLFDAANEPKMFVELRGDHNGGFVISEDIFKDGVRRFVSTYFGAVRSSQR